MPSLATLFVEFAVKNSEAVSTAVRGIGDQLRTLQSSVNALGAAVAEKFDAMARSAKQAADSLGPLHSGFQQLTDIINTGLQFAIGTIGGFVTAGLAASAMGQALTFQMERLALAVAGVFGPELLKVVELVGQFTDWLNSLSDAQKQSIAYWVEGAAAALGVALVFPKVVAATQAVIGAVQALTVAITTGLSATGIGALLPLVGFLIEAFTLLFVGTESGRNALGKLWEAFKPIVDVMGEIVSAVGAVVTDAFAALADALATLMQALSPAVSLLVKVGAAIVKALLIPFQLLAKAVRVVVEGLAWLAGAKSPFTKEESDKQIRRGSLAPRGGGPFNIGELYNQIAARSVGVGFGKTGVDKQIELQEKQLAEAEKTNQLLDNAPPLVK